MAKYELKYKPSKKGLFYNEKTSSSMKTKETIKRSIIYIVLVVISIIWLLPFIYLVIQSFAVSYSAEFNSS